MIDVLGLNIFAQEGKLAGGSLEAARMAVLGRQWSIRNGDEISMAAGVMASSSSIGALLTTTLKPCGGLRLLLTDKNSHASKFSGDMEDSEPRLQFVHGARAE